MFGTAVRDESEVFSDLADLCVSPGFVHVIAYFCFRDNLVLFGDEISAEDMAHQYAEGRLARTEISTLLGLLVRQPIDYTVHPQEVMQVTIDQTQALLLELHHALTKPWAEAFDPASGAIGTPFTQASGLREPIFYGPESAYTFQYRDLADAKYRADDDWLVANKGFRIGDAKSVAIAIGEILTERQTSALKDIRSNPAAVWTVLPGFTFEAAEMAQRCGLDPTVVAQVLDAFSLSELDRNASFTALNEFNATNATPIIKRDDGSFLLLQHYSLVEAIYETPFFWMLADRAYRPTAQAHRGHFTENFSAERLEAVFGAARVFKNVDIFRSKGEKHGEIDVLVLFGDRAIVVQNKSKRLTIEARKGNDLQLKDDFKKAIQDAADQAFLCAEALAAPGFRIVATNGNEIELTHELREIFPVCVVSDHYPALAFQARHFLKFNVTEVIRPPLVTDIFALDVMAEMLSSPLHLLHYISLRAKFGDRLVVSHELTTLGFHLKLNLWFDNEYDMMSLGDDIATDLDIAMMVRREGHPGPATPEGILTRLSGTAVGRMISEIEAQAHPDTTSLGLWLLGLNENTARTLSNGLDRIAGEARRDRRNHDVSVATGDPPSGLTVHCGYRGDDEAARYLQAHCGLRKHSQKANTWFGLLLNPDDGSIRLALTADFAWKPNSKMDKLVSAMPRGRPASILKPAGRSYGVLVGRNEPCPCGSGKKFKKCCL